MSHIYFHYSETMTALPHVSLRGLLPFQLLVIFKFLLKRSGNMNVHMCTNAVHRLEPVAGQKAESVLNACFPK